MAFFPAEVYALRSGLLESVVDFFCLVGLALVFDGDGFAASRRRLVLGGVAFGVRRAGEVARDRSSARRAGVCLPEIGDA